MLKKSVQIAFLFLACFIQLGHSLFPHTHETDHHHHNGTHHHHHDEEHSVEKGISHFFSHFNHAADAFSTTQVEEVSKINEKVPSDILVIEKYTTYTLSLTLYNKKEALYKKEPLIFISPHLHSLHFRGPPTLFS